MVAANPVNYGESRCMPLTFHVPPLMHTCMRAAHMLPCHACMQPHVACHAWEHACSTHALPSMHACSPHALLHACMHACLHAAHVPASPCLQACSPHAPFSMHACMRACSPLAPLRLHASHMPWPAAHHACAGKACKLSCAEALSAALYICGIKDEAFGVLSRFKWCVHHHHHHHHHQKAFRNKSHTSHGHRPGLKRNKSKGKR